jgi:hypothetical protein
MTVLTNHAPIAPPSLDQTRVGERRPAERAAGDGGRLQSEGLSQPSRADGLEPLATVVAKFNPEGSIPDALEGDLPSPLMLMEVGGPEASNPRPVDHGHGLVDPQLQQQDPAHRRIVHVCEGGLELGASKCEANFRHNRHHVESMDFLVSGGIFEKRIIPQGATISHPVFTREFSRILARMGSRKGDGVPGEILKLSPDSFQENLRLLINSVFASEFKMPKETLSAKVILFYKKGDPSLLVNYRPIALLTSTYQLMNLILAGWLQDLAERNGLFESFQFGFRWLHRVTDSVQKQQLLLKFAKAGDGQLICIDLDYANALNETLRDMLAFGPFWRSSGFLILTCS